MKTFFTKKTLILFICLFQVISTEQQIFNLERPFKPFISVLSPDSLKQFKKQEQKEYKNFQTLIDGKEDFQPFLSAFPYSIKKFSDNESDAYNFFSKIQFSVKCMFVDNFTLYDISGLGVNALQDNNEERAYTFESGNTSILYNFCHDLKKSNQCPYEKKQVYSKTKNGTEEKCEFLAETVNTGNTWYKGEKEGINYLRIDLNPDETHSVTYILECKSDMEEGKHTVDPSKSYVNEKKEDNRIHTLLYIQTAEACPKVDFYFMWRFINDFVFIFAIVLILFGIFNCLLGQKFAKFTSFLLSLFSVTILFLVFSQFILPSGCKQWIIWIMLVIGIILGCTAGYFVFKHHEKVLVFLVGGLGGFLLGEFLFNLFGNAIPLNLTLVNILFIVICIIVAIVIAFFLKDAIIIGFTSFIGSYSLIRGISLFAGYFPSEFTVIDLKNKGEDEQLENLLTWRVYVYLSFIVICTGLSIFLQIKIIKKFKSKEDGPECPDANLIGSSN